MTYKPTILKECLSVDHEPIIDDMSSDELQGLIEEIDKDGKTKEPIYYNNRMMPWDYRWFDLDNINVLFKGEIDIIEDGYASFWFDL